MNETEILQKKEEIENEQRVPTHDDVAEVCAMLLEEYGYLPAYDWVRMVAYSDDFLPVATHENLIDIARNRDIEVDIPNSIELPGFQR